MLCMPALEIGHPVTLFILMEGYDAARNGWTGFVSPHYAM